MNSDSHKELSPWGSLGFLKFIYFFCFKIDFDLRKSHKNSPEFPCTLHPAPPNNSMRSFSTLRNEHRCNAVNYLHFTSVSTHVLLLVQNSVQGTTYQSPLISDGFSVFICQVNYFVERPQCGFVRCFLPARLRLCISGKNIWKQCALFSPSYQRVHSIKLSDYW